jgi:3-deoxy-D-manno-octulosonic-acid transferase
MNALDVAYFAAVLGLAPVWMRKGRGGWRERRGYVEPIGEQHGEPAGEGAPGDERPRRPRVMLHGVSVGEVNALRDVVPRLARGPGGKDGVEGGGGSERGDGVEVLVTASTDTGLARAVEVFATPREGQAIAHVRRYPLDLSACVARFLDATRPDVVALCELEVWPNFIAACAARGIPVCVINGRLSERSFRGYRRVGWALRKTFASLAFAAVQDEAYAERFVHMGVPRQRVRITGSMKWDTAKIINGPVPGAADLAAALGIDRSRPLIVAGSTGPGEEALLHEACPPGVQLLCAPRKPERFDEAAAALPGCVRRSQVDLSAAGARPTSLPRSLGTHRARFLLDSIGELRMAYSLADIAVVGRSFINLHGSDPIEPIALGRPTLIGPRYGDFSTIVEALRAAGGLSVASSGELRVALQQLLDQPVTRARMAERGRACIAANVGATARHAEMILDLVRERGQGR